MSCSRYGRVEEKGAHLRGLGGQDLLEQIVQNEPVAAAELLDERSDRIGRCRVAGAGRDTATGREGRELEAGGPTLGPCFQGSHVGWSQLQAHDLVEEGIGLFGGEAQIGGADLEQLTTSPQTCQRQWRVRARRHGQGDLGWQVVEQKRHRVVDLRVVDHVVVVESEDSRARESIQVVDEAGDDVLDRQVAFGVHQHQRLATHLGGGGLHGGHQMSQKRPQVGVGTVEGQPADPQCLGCPVLGRGLTTGRQPLGQQGGLPEPGGGRNEHQPRHRRRLCPEPVDQALAGDQPTARGRGAQLGTQDRHLASVGAAVAAALAQARRSRMVSRCPMCRAVFVDRVDQHHGKAPAQATPATPLGSCRPDRPGHRRP